MSVTFDMIVGFAAGMVLGFICLLPALLVAVSAWGRWRRRAWIMRKERDEILGFVANAGWRRISFNDAAGRSTDPVPPYDAPPVPR